MSALSLRNRLRSVSTAVAVAGGVLIAAPGAVQAQSLAITGGTVHTLAGDAIADGTVIVDGGRIVSVGVGLAAPAGAQVVDATGLHLYPGLFDAFSQLVLKEINSVPVTNDNSEVGDFNPQLVAATAIHPASERIPVTRANGITHVVAAPSARSGGIGGQATVIGLAGWTIEEMEIARSVGMVVSWPVLSTQRCSPFGCFGPRRPFNDAQKTHDGVVERLRGWIAEARRYGRAAEGGDAGHRDLRLEALAAAADREIPFLVIADAARDIRDAVAFADAEDIAIVIVSGRDAAEVADFLAERDVPVLLRATQNTPNGADDPYAQTFEAAVTLHEAGVRFAMTGWASAGPNPPSRTLPYEAANAVGFGLPAEEALKAITRYPAEILGLGDELGTIEEGKIANLIVTDGDPLQIRTQVRYVIINGALASLDNKHKALWEKYRARR
jgi:imidazolonepropionase-like amidohydrolase